MKFFEKIKLVFKQPGILIGDHLNFENYISIYQNIFIWTYLRRKNKYDVTHNQGYEKIGIEHSIK